MDIHSWRNEKGQFLKNHPSFIKKGFKLSENHKKKLSLAHKGKRFTKEHRRNISKGMKGHFVSIETRLKISKANNNKHYSHKIPRSLKHRKSISLRMQGENHWNWKGGITEIKNRLRNSYLWRNWREKVFRRDNWICQECRMNKDDLEPHHKKSLRIIFLQNKISTYDQAIKIKEIFAIDNGITLCHLCHKKVGK